MDSGRDVQVVEILLSVKVRTLVDTVSFAVFKKKPQLLSVENEGFRSAFRKIAGFQYRIQTIQPLNEPVNSYNVITA